MQRCLNAHPDIEVVHQIREPEDPKDFELFKHLRASNVRELPADSSYLEHRAMKASSVLLLKNAVWTNRGKRRGFILVRNPFSVVVSAYRHARNPEADEHQRNQQIRWCRGIDRHMLPFIESTDIMTAWLSLYSRKMMHDRRTGLPVVRYEDFVTNPEAILRKLLDHLDLPWSDRVMQSHEDYREGELGHGNIKLWMPINTGSTEKYKALSQLDASQVYSLTHEVLHAYGYGWDGEELKLLPVKGLL